MRKRNLIINCLLIFIAVTSAIGSDKSPQTGVLVKRDVPFDDLRQFDGNLLRFHIDNRGSLFFDRTNNKGSFNWPDSTGNQYISGGGFYFAAQKRVNGELTKLVEYSYDILSANSMISPGRIEDGKKADSALSEKYQLYFSGDFNNETGLPKEKSDYNWPLWMTNAGGYDAKIGKYIDDSERRTVNNFQFGPAFFADDIAFCTYKDTDLETYSGQAEYFEELGYPLGIQYEQALMHWDSVENGNYVIIIYDLYNYSGDTLFNCHFAPAFDIGITTDKFPFFGMDNDHTEIVNIGGSPAINKYCLAYSDTNHIESGKNFGYVGLALILTPGVDANGYPEDKHKYILPNQQTGWTSFSQIKIDEPVYDNSYLYNRISSGKFDNDKSAGNQKVILGSGAFNLLPEMTARFAVVIGVSANFNDGEPDGSKQDRTYIDEIMRRAADKLYGDVLMNVEIEQPDSGHENDAEIFPNPTAGIINLKIISRNENTGNIEIFDLYGRHVMMMNNINFIQGMSQYQMNLSGLNQGTYFARIRLGNKVFTRVISIVK